MNDPLAAFGGTKATPQSQQIPGRTDQIANSGGGFGFAVTDQTRLLRFLVLGTESGTFYAAEKEHTLQNVELIQRLAATDGVNLVKTLVEVSEAGRAPKQNPTLYSLATACASSDQDTRNAAYAAIPRICRTGTMLFQFGGYLQAQRGWSRGLRSTIAAWYTEPDVAKVAYQAVKYRQRYGWVHRDMLRLSHPKTADESRRTLFDFICGRDVTTADIPDLAVVEGYQRLQSESLNAPDAAEIVRHYNLPWEAVPDQFLSEAVVWEAILESGMGIGALIRNLARLSKLGIISPLSARTAQIVARLTDADELTRGRIHPIQVLDAMLTYGQGHGIRGNMEWTVVPQIVDALGQAFYLAFGAVEVANKRTLLAIDVSGSMRWGNCAGSVAMTPAQGAAAMAMITARTEPEYHIMAFAHEFRPLPITATSNLSFAFGCVQDNNFGSTNCALPMQWADKNQVPVDTFCVYTDNETNSGSAHPNQALAKYRQNSGIDAKLVVIGMTATNVSIADPNDAGMMDVCGFDSATPNIISGFSAGRF